MATIITVHGTFANRLQSGDAWWQAGGPFEMEMRKLVNGADGSLNVMPLVWDGANSETSRRNAGAALATQIGDLEKQKQHYCILGHSHGGSVALSALLQRAAQQRQADFLSRWITVGTPFISFSCKRLVFFRLGLLGKAAYITVHTFLSLYCIMAALDNYQRAPALSFFFVSAGLLLLLLVNLLVGWRSNRNLLRSGAPLVSRSDGWSFWMHMGLLARIVYVAVAVAVLIIFMNFQDNGGHAVGGFLLFGGVFTAFHFVMLWIGRRQAIALASRPWVTNLSQRWLSLCHEKDEAVEGLKMLGKMSFPIFGRGVAIGPFMFSVLIAIPLVTILAVTSPVFMNWFVSVAHIDGFSDRVIANSSLVGGGHSVNINIIFLLALPVVLFFSNLSGGVQGVLLFTFAPLFYLMGAVVTVELVRRGAGLVSPLLSRNLNAVTWSQIRMSAYGNDTLGEVAMDAKGFPGLLDQRPFLPAEIAAEIDAVADAAAAATVSKMRSMLNKLAFSQFDRPPSDLISEYLTWDELIHTAYFKVPGFAKLIAYAIAQSDGFVATPAFLADPDYERVSRWYRALCSQSAARAYIPV